MLRSLSSSRSSLRNAANWPSSQARLLSGTSIVSRLAPRHVAIALERAKLNCLRGAPPPRHRPPPPPRRSRGGGGTIHVEAGALKQRLGELVDPGSPLRRG